MPDGDTLLSLLQRTAQAQGRNVSGARRKGSTLIRKICGIRLKGCPTKTFDSRAGASFTCRIRRFQQPPRDKEGAGCRNEAKLPADKHLLAQSAAVGRGGRQGHDCFRQRSGVVTHLALAYVSSKGNTRCHLMSPAKPAYTAAIIGQWRKNQRHRLQNPKQQPLTQDQGIAMAPRLTVR